jgi:hypothetical protein
MLEYQERLFGGPRHAVPLLDAKLTWDAFVPAEARALWRRMADRMSPAKARNLEFGHGGGSRRDLQRRRMASRAAADTA